MQVGRPGIRGPSAGTGTGVLQPTRSQAASQAVQETLLRRRL